MGAIDGGWLSLLKLIITSRAPSNNQTKLRWHGGTAQKNMLLSGILIPALTRAKANISRLIHFPSTRVDDGASWLPENTIDNHDVLKLRAMIPPKKTTTTPTSMLPPTPQKDRTYATL